MWRDGSLMYGISLALRAALTETLGPNIWQANQSHILSEGT